MIRCYVATNDAMGLCRLLSDLCTAGHFIDAYTLNRSLAACNKAECALDLTEALVTSEICADGMDAVGYNTLMKCSAKAGRCARCFELRTEMVAKGLELSTITYGILLDASVGAKELDCARKVFQDLCNSGLPLNVVHCTTFLKGLINAGHLDEAEKVLHGMACSSGVEPDLITYSTL